MESPGIYPGAFFFSDAAKCDKSMKMSVSLNRWVKCLSTQGNIRGVAIQATDLVQSMVDRHQLRDDAARGLGEAVMGALLIASYCRQDQRINLNIQGSKQFKQALVDAYPDGRVRGYIIERGEAPPLVIQDKVGPWGQGLLSVLRTKVNEGEKPYIGTVPLLTGHLAKDLSFYWVQSEQIPSAVGLAVNIEGGRISSAGGFLVQALPGASAAEVNAIEYHIHEMQSLAESIARDATPIQILSQIFQSTAFMVVEEKSLQFKCECSAERVERALTLVGVAELQSMLAEDQSAIVRCDFCAKEYHIDGSMLEKLIQRLNGHPSGDASVVPDA
jgi:molecular chaperone Hsp33